MSTQAFAYILNESYTLQKVDTQQVVETLSEPHFATHLSVGADQTLWVVRKNSEGPGWIQFSEDGGKTWNTPGDEVKKEAVQICGTPKGNCTYLTEDARIWVMEKSGKTFPISPPDTAKQVSISPDGIMWVLSKQEKELGGHFIFFTPLQQMQLQQITNGAVCRELTPLQRGRVGIITIGGEVATIGIQEMGALQSEAGKVFASAISSSPASNLLWVIQPNKNPNKAGTVAWWNIETGKFLEWNQIEGVKARAISGAN
jgi:hypothetical protein